MTDERKEELKKGYFKVSKKAYKQRFVDIIVEAFEHNPSVVDVVKQDNKRSLRVRRLAEYSYEFGKRRDGLKLSKDENGMAIFYVEDMKRTLADHLADLKLIFQVSGLKRTPYLLRKEAYRNSVRPKEPFLYVWFLGVASAHRGSRSVFELKNEIFEASKRLNLPILLETTIEQNMRVYERFGFKTYHVHQYHDHIPPMYFMRRDV